MMLKKSTTMRLVVLAALLAPWLEAAHPQVPGSPAFNTEMSRQESIYRGKGEERVDGYTVDRSLLDYTHALGPAFDSALASLGPGDRWLDIGAGRAQAILDYYAPAHEWIGAQERERSRAKAQAVALSIEDRRTPRWDQTVASLERNKIRYLHNKRLREYSAEELGRFQVITDVIGGFSYTEDLSRFVEKVLGLLELNGSFFTLLQDVRSEGGANPPHYQDSPFLTEITNAAGSEVTVCAWLKSISCVEVSCEFTGSWVPPIEAYRVRKVCNDVSVPALASLHYTAGTPPERRFLLPNPPPAPPAQAQRTEPAKQEAAKQ